MNWPRGSRRGRSLITTGYCDCWTLIDDCVFQFHPTTLFAREVLDAIGNDQIDESNYELHCGEIGDPLRQVTVVYDKRDQTVKGFFIG